MTTKPSELLLVDIGRFITDSRVVVLVMHERTKMVAAIEIGFEDNLIPAALDTCLRILKNDLEMHNPVLVVDRHLVAINAAKANGLPFLLRTPYSGETFKAEAFLRFMRGQFNSTPPVVDLDRIVKAWNKAKAIKEG